MASVEPIAHIKELFNAGQHEEACQACESLCKKNPKNLEALKLAGKIFGLLGLFSKAQTYLSRAIELAPNDAETIFNLGICHREQHDHSRATLFFSWYSRLSPDDAGGWYCLSQSQYEQKDYVSATASITRAIALNKFDAEAYALLGLIQGKQSIYQDALQNFEKALRLDPQNAQTLFYKGVALAQMERVEESLNAFNQSLAIKSDNPEALLHKAASLEKVKEFDEALETYDQAISIDPQFSSAWFDKGVLLADLNRHEEAISHYDQGLKINPRYAEGWSNKGISLMQLRRYFDALVHFDSAASQKPDLIEALTLKGVALRQLGRYDEALNQFNRVISLNPAHAEAWREKGVTLQDTKNYEDALACMHQALTLDPNRKFLLGDYLGLKMKACDWEDLEDYTQHIISTVNDSGAVIQPFTLLNIKDDPSLHLKSAQIFCQNEIAHFAESAIPRKAPNKKIRIGYFSGDFRNHPLSYLTAEMFEQHNHELYETYGFSIGPNPDHPIRARISSSFDKFFNCENHSDDELIQLARSLNLDIAVDLHGHTKYNRTGIFLSRVAPIQVNFLGYPGTVGADSIDYIVADEIVIPQSSFSCFSESVVYMPDCYMPNDSKREISEKKFTRNECGLPEDAFVFCCFNDSGKILPTIFKCWMRILLFNKNSVLWLMGTSALAEKNLRQSAEKYGVDSNRLIFTKFLPLEEHLSRISVGDLFLDTHPYNAHTTASDALWTGLPLITYQGESFASRVASSLLNAIELPELITKSLDDYENLAIELSKSPEKLTKIRARLAQNRLSKPLFNGAIFCKNLERAYTEMVRRYRAGLKPDSFLVKDLKNSD